MSVDRVYAYLNIARHGTFENPIVNSAKKELLSNLNENNEDITMGWVKEGDTVSGKIKEVYPIITKSGEPTGHYGIIFEADSGRPEDGASESYRGRDYSEFEVGQKVGHITYKRERPATDKEKEYLQEDTVTDFVYVTVPDGADEKEYLRKALLADYKEKKERDERLADQREQEEHDERLGQ